MKSVLSFAAAAVISFNVHAACSLTLDKDDVFRGKRYELSWSAVPGATGYLVEAFRINFNGEPFSVPEHIEQVSSGSSEITHRVELTASRASEFLYRVTPVGVADCHAETRILFAADENFIRTTRRSVIPLVGSTRGQNGAVFKTSVRLRATSSGISGKLVFRQLGVPGTDADPSIAYSFSEPNEVREFDDIVAAFGRSGLGSIDIIPDGPTYIVPYAETRLFNVSDEGTYGTIESQTQGYDFAINPTTPSSVRGLTATVPDPSMRLNLGVRTLEAGTVSVYTYRGKQQIGFRLLELGRDTLVFTSAADFTGVGELQPGDTIRVTALQAMIPMYTLTDNKTNDPALFYPPTRIDLRVGDYEIFD